MYNVGLHQYLWGFKCIDHLQTFVYEDLVRNLFWLVRTESDVVLFVWAAAGLDMLISSNDGVKLHNTLSKKSLVLISTNLFYLDRETSHWVI